MTKSYQTNADKFNKWRDEQEVAQIYINDIQVSHQIHLNTDTIDFNGGILKPSYTKKGLMPLVVRDLGNGKYQLLFGLKQFIKLKILSVEYAPCVVLKHSTRGELVRYIEGEYNVDDMFLCSIDSIKITTEFTSSTPRQNKVERKSKEIEDGLISLITIDKYKELKDGYITYLILKERGDKNVMVKIVD